jgi:hypothetical protein
MVELRYGIAGSALCSEAATSRPLIIRLVPAPGERAKRVLQAPVIYSSFYKGFWVLKMMFDAGNRIERGDCCVERR